MNVQTPGTTMTSNAHSSLSAGKGQMVNGWTSRGASNVQFRPNNPTTNNVMVGSRNRDYYGRPQGPTVYGTGLPGNWYQR